MFIDPTVIVDNVLAGYWDAADALDNSPYVGDPEGLRSPRPSVSADAQNDERPPET